MNFNILFAEADDISPNFVNSSSVSSPTIYSTSSSVTSGTQVSSDSGEKSGGSSQGNYSVVFFEKFTSIFVTW